jgi:hypothetical protein
MARVTSRSVFNSTISLKQQDPRMRQLGWDQAGLRRLLRTSRDISLNLDRVLHDRFSVNVLIDKLDPDIKGLECAASLDGSEIKLSLALGQKTEAMLSHMPHNLSLHIGELIIEKHRFNNNFIPSFCAKVDPAEELMTDLCKVITVFYARKLGLLLNPVNVLQDLGGIIESLGRQTMRYYLTIELMQPHQMLRHQIAEEIEDTVRRITEVLTITVTEENPGIDIWHQIAILSLLSVIAQKTGHQDLADLSLDHLTGEYGLHLSAADFLQFGLGTNPMFISQPILAQSLMTNANRIYRTIYHRLNELYSLAYDHADQILEEMA